MEIFTYTNLVRAFSGGTAAAFATFVFFPVETARTHMQVNDKFKGSKTRTVLYSIARSQGWLSLYTGLIPVLFAVMLGNCVYFFIFHGVKSTLNYYRISQTSANDLAIGFFAGVVVGVITNPMWVVIIRLRTQSHNRTEPMYNGIIDGILKISKSEGMGALNNGLLISIILSLNPAVNFMIYESLRRALTVSLGIQNLGSLVYFMMGGASKGASTLITYPLQVLQNRQRVSQKADSFIAGLYMSFKDLIGTHGMSGLYMGLRSKLAQMVLTAALMFTTYEKITASVLKLAQVDVSNSLGT